MNPLNPQAGVLGDSSRKVVIYGVPALLLLAVALFFVARSFAGQQAAAVNLSDPRVYTIDRSPEIEERYGVRFTFLAVTGDGGLIDLRYRIVDEGRAKNFGHYTETSPLLIVEDSGATIDVTKMGLHNHRVQLGRTYYILYRNTGNAIKPGDKVTIAINDTELKHVVAR